jgi:hypothetical protein
VFERLRAHWGRSRHVRHSPNQTSEDGISRVIAVVVAKRPLALVRPLLSVLLVIRIVGCFMDNLLFDPEFRLLLNWPTGNQEIHRHERTDRNVFVVHQVLF